MKKSKLLKIVSVLLALSLFVSVLAACGDTTAPASTPANDISSTAAESTPVESEPTDAGTDEDPYKITMAIIGNEQPNQDKVWQAVNDLMLEEINMTFEPILLSFGDYQEQLRMMLSAGDELDVLPIFYDQASSYINSGQIVDLADYIYDYGQGILDYMGEDIATSGAVNGFIYGIPANKESNTRSGIVMRKDIIDEIGVDVSTLKSPRDLTAVFEQAKAAHPEMDMISGSRVITTEIVDPLFDWFGVLMDYGQDTTVTNYFESKEYKDRADLTKEWYDAGYVKLDAATTTETNANLVKAGSLFSYMAPIKPGYLIQENINCGTEMVTAYLGDLDGGYQESLWTSSVNFFDWGIAQQSKDKVKAMEFLNYAYNSPEWNNLMNFGIEGEDYVPVEGSDVLIDYPEGKGIGDAYHMNMGWMYPNQMIGKIWNGNPEDLWDQYTEFNKGAVLSKAFGFIYDSSSVATELTALNSVRTEFMASIETGSVPDVDQAIKDFNDKLYAAGLQKVIDLKQEQLDAWLAAQ